MCMYSLRLVSPDMILCCKNTGVVIVIATIVKRERVTLNLAAMAKHCSVHASTQGT